jgi:spore maturation protein CgeB
MNRLEKNLAILRRRQPEVAEALAGLDRSPEVELLQSRSGALVHRYRGRLLHSQWDPAREAGLLADRQGDACSCVYGFGSGYHVEALLARDKGREWLVVEPDGRLLKAVLEDRDLGHLLRRVSLVVDAAPEEAAEAIRESVSGWCVHPPSGQLHCRHLEALRAFSSYRPMAGHRLRILVVGPVYGGSYPIACFATEALKGLGHHVSFLDLTPFHPGYRELQSWGECPETLGAFERFLSGLIEQRARVVSPDLVLCLAQAPVRGESLKRLRGAGVPIAYWFVEDFRRMLYWKGIAPFSDAFFVIQRAGQDEMRAAGAACVRYLPTAAQRGTHEPMQLRPEDVRRYGGAVSFVGAGYLNRRRFMARLASLDLKIWGNEWDGASSILEKMIQEEGRRVGTEETAKIFNATKINLNLHSSPCHEDVDPFGDFLNPRTFEIAACGAFQLVDERSLLREAFAEHEMAVFEDLEDAREKIRYFLEHEEERRAYAREGRRRVLREHTYELRMKELLGVLYENGLEARSPDREEGEHGERRNAGDLDAYLADFPGPAVPELEEIVARIEDKEEVTWEDRLFLTLMAFKEEARCKASSS